MAGKRSAIRPVVAADHERLSFREAGVTGPGALKTSRNACGRHGRLAKCPRHYVVPQPKARECGAFVEKRTQLIKPMISLIYFDDRRLCRGQFLARVLNDVKDLQGGAAPGGRQTDVENDLGRAGIEQLYLPAVGFGDRANDG